MALIGFSNPLALAAAKHFLGYMYTETFPKQPAKFNVACRQMISAINIWVETFYWISAVCHHNHNDDEQKGDDARGTKHVGV